MDWREFVISFPPEAREPLTAVLFEMGCLGTAEDDGRVTAYFPPETEPDEVIDVLSAFEGVTVDVRTLKEQDWYAPYKERLGPYHAAGLLICPPWKDCTPEKTERLLVMDPGQAFGAGDHESTCMVLKLMRAWADVQKGLPGRKFLDVGTGTGILSVAACLFGIGHVTAVDIDPKAVESAARNLELNHVSDRVRLILGSVGDAGSGYDLIAANLFQEPLIDIAPDMARALKPRGTLIASGLLDGQEPEFYAAAMEAGLRFEEELRDGRWVSARFAA